MIDFIKTVTYKEYFFCHNNSNTMEDYTVEEHYIFASSLDRDTSAYPKTSQFKLSLPDQFQNIVSIELSAGSVPNLGSVDADPYLLLSIEGLNHIQSSSGVEYFSVLALHKGHSNAFFNMDRSSSAMMPYKLYSPKQRLNSLNIKLLHSNGTPLTFGADGNLLQINQVSFTFCVKILRNKRRSFDKDFRALFKTL